MNEDRDSFFRQSAIDLLEKRCVPKYDFHIHTTYTDGHATVRQVFEKAIEVGLEAIAFTEHTEKWHNADPVWFSNYVDEISKIRIDFASQIQAFIGIEAPAISFDGEIDASQEMLRKAEFILGAAHRYPGMDGRKVSSLSNVEAIDLEFRTLMGLADSKQINAIAHIGATCAKYCTPFPEDLIKEVIRKAVKNDIAIEINPRYHHPVLKFLELCAEENAFITLGSNAHGFNDIGLIERTMNKDLKS